MIRILIRAHISGASAVSKGRRIELKHQKQGWLYPFAIIGSGIGAVSIIYALVTLYRLIIQVGMLLGHDDLVIFSALSLSWVIFLQLYTLTVVSGS